MVSRARETAATSSLFRRLSSTRASRSPALIRRATCAVRCSRRVIRVTTNAPMRRVPPMASAEEPRMARSSSAMVRSPARKSTETAIAVPWSAGPAAHMAARPRCWGQAHGVDALAARQAGAGLVGLDGPLQLGERLLARRADGLAGHGAVHEAAEQRREPAAHEGDEDRGLPGEGGGPGGQPHLFHGPRGPSVLAWETRMVRRSGPGDPPPPDHVNAPVPADVRRDQARSA